MTIPPARRHYVLVLIMALLFRVGFLVWNWSGYYVRDDSQLCRSYFWKGYAIAAGYGYTTAEGSARDHLFRLERRVNDEHIRVTPESAGPLTGTGIRPEMIHPPGLSLLIAGLNRLFAYPADIPVQIIGLLLDTLAALIVCWIAGTVFGARMGLVSGLVYALFPPLAHQAVAKMPGGLLSLFVVAALACIIQAEQKHGRRVLVWLVAGGVMLGLGSYLRPDYMLMPVVAGLGVWVWSRRFFRSAARMILMQVVVLLVLLPWAWRNHELSGRWIFTSSSVGGTLITGLAEFQNPWGFGATDQHRIAQAKAQGMQSAWTPEADGYFRDLFWKSVRQHPGAYLKSVVKRIPLALAGPYGWGLDNPLKTKTFTQTREAGEDRYQAVKSKPLYILGAYWDRLLMSGVTILSGIGVLAMLILERKQLGLVFLILSPHVYSIATHMLTHIEPRFLIPSMFSWLIGLAYLLARGWRDRADREWSPFDSPAT